MGWDFPYFSSPHFLFFLEELKMLDINFIHLKIEIGNRSLNTQSDFVSFATTGTGIFLTKELTDIKIHSCELKKLLRQSLEELQEAIDEEAAK